MILQALTNYYEILRRKGVVGAPGWGPAKVSYVLYLREDGSLARVAFVQTGQRDHGTVPAPQTMELPAPVKRTVGVAANFLWDNSSYMLGADAKDRPQRTAECFAACRTLHEQLLSGVDTPAARAVRNFFRTWEPEHAREHPALAGSWEAVLSGVNLVFRIDGQYAHDDPAIRQAWDRFYSQTPETGGPETVCLVTGERVTAESVHPSIKGVAGAQSSGAALVSFNAPAFCSYGKEQNLNAPVGKYAAFAYTTALNHLLADRTHTFRMGDATVLFWARCGETAYPDFFASVFSDTYGEQDLRQITEDLCQGHEALFDEAMLDPNMDFYVLGLSPSAARLSVRFFLHNTFGGFLKNIQAHQERLRIVHPAYETFEVPSLKKLLDATVNQNSKDKQASPELAGEMLRAVLNDTPYPAILLYRMVLRIRAEHKITWPRAAALKAYYLKNPNQDVPKEVLTVSLNETSGNISYQLGRLFSVLEAIQQSANPGINSTIKDKYFNSASATPALVFPTLINLAQKHLKKLGNSQRIFWEKQLQTILFAVDDEFPARLNLPQQGSFQLGYYHQTQARYQKKEENEHV